MGEGLRHGGEGWWGVSVQSYTDAEIAERRGWPSITDQRWLATVDSLRTRLAAAEGLLRHAQDWIGMALKSMPPNSRRDTLPFLKDIAAHFTPAPATGHDAKED